MENGSKAAVSLSQESHIFAGGSVDSSDDWTEIGADPIDDDDMDALAQLSLKDDSSFIDAIRSSAGKKSPSQSTSQLASGSGVSSGRKSVDTEESIDGADDLDDVENIEMLG